MITIAQVAKTCHEVNRAYCESMGDLSIKPWNEAPDWQKDSSLRGVRFLLDNPNSTPIDQHEAWLKDKHLAGWKYGPIKDEIKKENPCILPYGKLPLEQRAKDYLFQAVVRSLLL